jgi:hypothetical protein
MLEFLLGVMVGAALLYLMTIWLMEHLIARAMQQGSADRELANSVIRARVEQIGNEFYIYNIDKNEFLVQGRDMKELVDNLELRKPGAVIGVVDGDEQAIQNLKATMQ